MTMTLDENALEMLRGLRTLVLPMLYDNSKIETERHSSILALFINGDETDPEKFKAEAAWIASILSKVHQLKPAKKAPSKADYLVAILREALKSNKALALPLEDDEPDEINSNLVNFSHQARMELSRAEMEPIVLLGLAFELEMLGELEKALKPFASAFQKYASRLTLADINLESAFGAKNAELNSILLKLSKKLREEKSVFKDIQEAYSNTIAKTNDGLHVIVSDTSKMRFKDEMTPENVRTIENLTKIWVKYVDPKLGLPARDGVTDNPYSRYITYGLAFLGITNINTNQIVDRAHRVFKPQFVKKSNK